MSSKPMSKFDRINRDADEFNHYNERLHADAYDIVFGMYAYVGRSSELRHLAAAVAYLYTSSLHTSCPAAAPRSYITDNPRMCVPARYMSPRSLKPLNSMLRHAYNYFDNIQSKFNFEDADARETEDSTIFMRARSLCSTIKEVFGILVEADKSRTKDSTASRLFQQIGVFCVVPPKTLAEERAASSASQGRCVAERAAGAAVGGAGAGSGEPTAEEKAAAAAEWKEDDSRIRAEAEEARRRAAEKAAAPVAPVAAAPVAPVIEVVVAPLAPAPKPKNLSGWLKKK